MPPSAQLAPLFVIDDDPDAHFLLGRCLSRAGINNPLDIAADGIDAIKYFERCIAGEQPWPLVVFLDIKMPGMDGFDVLKWLGAKGVLGKTVVAMMSSSDAPNDVTQAFNLGAHTYLNKNVTAQVLGPIVLGAMKISAQQSTPSKSP